MHSCLQRLAEQILENVTLPSYSRRGVLSNGGNPVRLQAKTWANLPRPVNCILLIENDLGM
jgi:hypothetical protein